MENKIVAQISSDILKAKKHIEKGELVGIPTETVYGLAANVFDEKAILNIFKTKERPHFDPLIVHTHSIKELKKLAIDIPEKAFLLAKTFWPGPLTILLKKNLIIPDLVTSGLATVAVRIPNHELTLELLKSLDFPLAAPSANPFGYVSPTTASHVDAQLGEKIPYILDGGQCNVGLESTIIGFNEEHPTIYRLGGLSVEDIENVIGKTQISLNKSSNPVAPGMLKSHYAPKKSLIIGNINELIIRNMDKKIGVISFKNDYYQQNLSKQIILSEKGSLDEAAQRIFSALREMDEASCDLIITEKLPEVGLGKAINDRLERASIRY